MSAHLAGLDRTAGKSGRASRRKEQGSHYTPPALVAWILDRAMDGRGTPVRAPAAGVVTLAAPDFYLTGGTLLLDHGHGISSNFLHLSRIDVQVGDRIEQGQVIGAVGATGRATGPHLHWGMNWFDVRIDPLLVLEK